MTSSTESALLAQASPAGAALATDRHFQLPDHLSLISREIGEAIARAQASRQDHPEILLVEVPPRHGKSTLISENTPVWFLGTFREQKVILASYGAEFAASWGGKARDKLERYGPELYGVSVDRRTSSAKRWRVAGHAGSMITAGVGGPITGEGAHLMIIDDPIKNAEEAMSEVIREKHWDWWLSTARTRLEPGAVVVVLMTRWHEGDLGGRLLLEAEAGGDPVREIRLPALALAEDPLGRKVGEPLWPERYSREYLEQTQSVLGAYWFSAMYQGTPTPDEGGIYNRRDFNYFDLNADGSVTLHRPDGTKETIAKDWLRKFQVVDLAAGEKETSDYTVMGEMWVTPKKDMLVRAVVRDRLAVPDQPKFFEANHAGGRVKFESIGYQTGMVQTMLRRGFPAEPVYPDKDKVTRAGVAGALYRGGKVYHRRGAEWLPDFEAELLAFPAGEHDDQADMVAYAAKALPEISAPKVRKREDRRRPSTAGLMKKQM